MLVLAGGGLAVTGLLVVYGSLTGRLGAMLAAVFKPDDLEGGFTSSTGETLGQFLTPGLPGGGKAGGTVVTTPVGPVIRDDPIGTLFPGFPGTPAPVIAPAPVSSNPGRAFPI